MRPQADRTAVSSAISGTILQAFNHGVIASGLFFAIGILFYRLYARAGDARLDIALILLALAAIGVLYLTVATAHPPWIALALAASFGTYGLIRKVVKVESVPGLATETLLLAPLAVAFLAWCEMRGTGALGHSSAGINALLVGSGLITALPLALFAYGARRIPLSTVGLVQYIGPTLQFLIGVFVFHEAFTAERAVGFVMIWAALAIYAADGAYRTRRRRSGK